MNKFIETEPKNSKSLLNWIFWYAIGINFYLYIIEIIFVSVSNFFNGDPTTLPDFFLGMSRNWKMFLEIKITVLAFGIIITIAVWAYQRYWSQTDKIS
jgi:hypothetical protein